MLRQNNYSYETGDDMDKKTVVYKKYKPSYESEVLKVFTKAFENYPLFCIYRDAFRTEKKFRNCYTQVMTAIFRATIRKDKCYVGFVDGRITALVVIEAPTDKPVSFWDYTVCGMPRIIVMLGLMKTLRYLKLSEETEYAVKEIKEPRWHLYFLAVDPKSQGKGIGSDAIQHFLIPLVRKNGGKLITVTTNSEKNVPFYLGNGFNLVKEETLGYNGKTVGNWTFRMDL